MPDTITERTRALAAELTAGLETPYAKARALELYLRQFEYDLTVAASGPDVTDVADYFLSTCSGAIATTTPPFVVLARPAGLPTRCAGLRRRPVGRLQPRWVVTEAEAHSWPEVYFPEYGWIPSSRPRPPLNLCASACPRSPSPRRCPRPRPR
ncbi:MAG: transglutaminase-like domain-containing protein [Caldilineaceae bacterium]